MPLMSALVFRGADVHHDSVVVPAGISSVSVPLPSFAKPPSPWRWEILKFLNVRSPAMSKMDGYSPRSRHGRSISVAAPE